MDFITASIVGGMLYDILKLGVTESAACVNVALKDMLLTDEEKALIAQDFALSTEEDRSSKANLESFFESRAPNTKKILNTYTQNNINHNGTGDIVLGDKKDTIISGDQVKGNKEVHHHHAQNIDPKKS